MDTIKNNSQTSSFFGGARSVAVQILSRFERSDAYLDKLLDYEYRTGELNSLDQSLMTEILYGVIRYKNRLDFVLNGFYNGDYMKCLNIVKNTLRVALYQIMFLDKIPIPAAINEAVELVKRIQGVQIAGVVNGVLRNIARNFMTIRYPDRDADLVYYLTVMESHPRWLVRRWVKRFGAAAAELFMKKNNMRPATTIRVNTLRNSKEEISKKLTERGIEYNESKYLQDTLIITNPKIKVPSLDLFRDGLITIQDTSASLATNLTKATIGENIIDLCAAPGGKSFLMAEMSHDQAKIISVDKFQQKIRILDESIERMGYKSIVPVIGDATDFPTDEKFDLVLTDVPCSGLGVLAKKPDIKWKREREDIFQLAELQRRIIDHAALLVKKGGRLVYSTCTTEPEENTDNIKYFLEKHPEFELEPAENYLPSAVCLDGMMQTFPFMHNIDGAFAARMKRKE